MANSIKIFKKICSKYRPIVIFLLNKFLIRKKLNVGSGKRDWLGWNLVDEVNGLNIRNIKFSQDSDLPFKTSSQKLIYSSHFFEHTSPSQLSKVLSEIYRVMSPNGLFIIKLPNWDKVLDTYFSKDFNYIESFPFGDLPQSWPLHAVENNIENKMSMIFAGYFTKHYGDYFINNNSGSTIKGYHGPAKINLEELIQIFKSRDPNKISNMLSSIIKKDPDFYRFNHQQAWSKNQFESLLNLSGFRLLSADQSLIRYAYRNIADFESMKNISNYYFVNKLV